MESKTEETLQDGAPSDKVNTKGEEAVTSQRRSPRKSKKRTASEVQNGSAEAETTEMKETTAKKAATTRTRKRKANDTKKDAAEMKSDDVKDAKSPTADAATSPFVKSKMVRRRKNANVAKTKRKRNVKGGRGKRKDRGPLPSFDDDDDEDAFMMDNGVANCGTAEPVSCGTLTARIK